MCCMMGQFTLSLILLERQRIKYASIYWFMALASISHNSEGHKRNMKGNSSHWNLGRGMCTVSTPWAKIYKDLCLLCYLSQYSFNVIKDLITQKITISYFLSLKIKNNKQSVTYRWNHGGHQRGKKVGICLLSWTIVDNFRWMLSNLVVFLSGPGTRCMTGLHARPPVSRLGRALPLLPLAPSPAYCHSEEVSGPFPTVDSSGFALLIMGA